MMNKGNTMSKQIFLCMGRHALISADSTHNAQREIIALIAAQGLLSAH
jgi:hypothetical protein